MNDSSTLKLWEKSIVPKRAGLLVCDLSSYSFYDDIYLDNFHTELLCQRTQRYIELIYQKIERIRLQFKKRKMFAVWCSGRRKVVSMRSTSMHISPKVVFCGWKMFSNQLKQNRQSIRQGFFLLRSVMFFINKKKTIFAFQIWIRYISNFRKYLRNLLFHWNLWATKSRLRKLNAIGFINKSKVIFEKFCILKLNIFWMRWTSIIEWEKLMILTRKVFRGWRCCLFERKVSQIVLLRRPWTKWNHLKVVFWQRSERLRELQCRLEYLNEVAVARRACRHWLSLCRTKRVLRSLLRAPETRLLKRAWDSWMEFAQCSAAADGYEEEECRSEGKSEDEEKGGDEQEEAVARISPPVASITSTEAGEPLGLPETATAAVFEMDSQGVMTPDTLNVVSPDSSSRASSFSTAVPRPVEPSSGHNKNKGAAKSKRTAVTMTPMERFRLRLQAVKEMAVDFEVERRCKRRASSKR